MIKFDEKAKVDSVAGALKLRAQVEKYVDEICKDGYDSIWYIGIGGTYASGMQAVNYAMGKSALPIYLENAAEYYTRGNKRITDKSVLVFSSVTGTTEEVVKAVKAAKEVGARIFGFLDIEKSPLGDLSDYLVVYPENEDLKFFMVVDRLMKNNGDFPEYDAYYAELEKHLPRALMEVEKQADDFAQDFVAKHHDDPIHYFVGAGNLWGATYSYAMCYWEEMHWRRTKSIHAAEFFHGTLEMIDRDTAVTVFVGEDSERALAERVANFLPRICAQYTIIDTKDYKLAGISEKFRPMLSHLVMHGVYSRIDAHMERVNCHPMDIRRYYRRLDY